MRLFSRWILALFASPMGVFVLGALDSTLFFNLPLGIDAAVVILAAQLGDLWWIAALLAVIGSVLGAALTFWMGKKIGEAGLDRWVPSRGLTQIRKRAREQGAIALAVLDLIPPPFPFTLFVLAAGALDVDARTFFVTLTACRVLRFGIEAALALIYGQRILSWLDSDLFHDIVGVFIVLAVVLTAISIARVIKTSGRQVGRRAPV
jgi:membrane protein YqaA with SNARE-associated domain